MGYVIVGAGSLGQVFAALLAGNGHAVTLLASERTAEALRTGGALQLHGAVEARVPVVMAGTTAATTTTSNRSGTAEAHPVHSVGAATTTDASHPAAVTPPNAVVVTSNAADLPDGAQVVFTTKGQDLPAAIAQVRAAAAQRITWACGVQNGVVKDDLLKTAFGVDRVLCATTILGAQRQPDGSVRVNSPGATYLGELDGPVSDRVRQAAADFQAAGIPAQARDDIQSVLWSKACNATGVFGVTVLGRLSNDRLFSRPHFMRAYLALVRETAAVAAACGVQVGDYPSFPTIRSFVDQDEDAILARLSQPAPASAPPSYASMTQDLLAGLPLEVDAVFGDIVERAQRSGVEVPCLRLVRDLIRGLDPAHAPTAADA